MPVEQEVNKGGAYRCVMAVEHLVSPFFHLTIIDGMEHIEEIRRRRVESWERRPLIIAFRHVKVRDIIDVLGLALQAVDYLPEEIIMPTSEHYVHFFHHPPYTIADALCHKYGVETPRVIQSYRLDDDRLDREAKSKLVTLSEELGTALIHKIKKGFVQGKCLVIAPEGHRSSSSNIVLGGLQPAEAGIGLSIRLLIKSGMEADVLPIGIIPDRNKPRSYGICVGKSLNLKQIYERASELAQTVGLNNQDKTIINSLLGHALMTFIAELLPKEQWGVYDPASAYYKDTLLGELKLRTRGGIVNIYKK